MLGFSEKYKSDIQLLKGDFAQLEIGRDDYVTKLYKVGYYSESIPVSKSVESLAISRPNGNNTVKFSKISDTMGQLNARYGIVEWSQPQIISYNKIYASDTFITVGNTYLLVLTDGPTTISGQATISNPEKSWVLMSFSSGGGYINSIYISGVDKLGLSYDYATGNIILYGSSNNSIRFNDRILILRNDSSLYSFYLTLSANLVLSDIVGSINNIIIDLLDVNGGNIAYTFYIPNLDETDLPINDPRSLNIINSTSRVITISPPKINIIDTLDLEIVNNTIAIVGKQSLNAYIYYIFDLNGTLIKEQNFTIQGKGIVNIITCDIIYSNEQIILCFISKDLNGYSLGQYSLTDNIEMWSYYLIGMCEPFHLICLPNNVIVYSCGRYDVYEIRFPALIGVVNSSTYDQNTKIYDVAVDFIMTAAICGLNFGHEYYITDDGKLTDNQKNNTLIGTAIRTNKLLMVSTINQSNISTVPLQAIIRT